MGVREERGSVVLKKALDIIVVLAAIIGSWCLVFLLAMILWYAPDVFYDGLSYKLRGDHEQV